jgi:ABC-type uncharacterized transport system substrate-binding protein
VAALFSDAQQQGKVWRIGYRRAATCVGKILKGTQPGDLPVEQPAKFEMFIDGKTAKVMRPQDPTVAACNGRQSDRVRMRTSPVSGI